MDFVRRNAVLLLLLAAAGFGLFAFICPGLRAVGYEWLCFALLAVLVLAFVYARSEKPVSRRR